ncbi:MAG: hypothetical protein KA118_09545 [Verrucomicrobia bacterium]|nr:hypothetical protein [Verrucomicrobiota bacterium]
MIDASRYDRELQREHELVLCQGHRVLWRLGEQLREEALDSIRWSAAGGVVGRTVKTALKSARQAVRHAENVVGTAKSVGYHATKPQNAPYIMRQGVRPSISGRLGEGVYVSDTVEGAIAEYNAHHPGLRLKPAVIEIEYYPGVNLKVTPPTRHYEGPLPFTQNADTLTAPSVRAGGTMNTVIRNGTAVPVRRAQ